MDLSTLMKNSQTQLKPFWVYINRCLFCLWIIDWSSFGVECLWRVTYPFDRRTTTIRALYVFFKHYQKETHPSFFDLFEGFKPLLNVLLLFFIINALTILGLLFLIVPGIIISLGFSMSYYILSENTEMSFSETLEKSWKLMDGNKMELFMLHLRFIPYYLLGLLLFIVGVFIVCSLA